MKEQQAVQALAAIAQEVIDARLPLAVYSLRSTSLCPGGTGRSGTAEGASAIRRRSRAALADLVGAGRMVPVSAADVETMFFPPPAP